MLHTAQDTGARIVIASPYAPGGQTTNVPFVRRVLSRNANRMLGAAAGGGLTTLTGMVRVYGDPSPLGNSGITGAMRNATSERHTRF